MLLTFLAMAVLGCGQTGGTPSITSPTSTRNVPAEAAIQAPVAPPIPTDTATPEPTATPVAKAPPPQPTPTATGVPVAVSPTQAPFQPKSNVALWQRRGTALAEAAMANVTLGNAGVGLAKGAGGYATTGTITTQEHAADMSFDNAVLSWNAGTPSGTSVRFELRVSAGGAWSAWYVMGTWGAGGGRSQANQQDAMGAVDVDTLELKKAADRFQVRAILQTQDVAATPTLQMISLVYADRRAPLSGPPISPAAGWARELPVPTYSQLDEDPAIANSICSPTSLAMVLNYYGRGKRVADVAKGVHNATGGSYPFGNWPFNTAYAAMEGTQAYVTRLYSMAQIQEEIAVGHPVPISIKFQPGELHGAPIDSTGGHFIVVRGFTAAGDVIVNDPFGPNAAGVRRVYKRAELEPVWLRSGGIAYIVSPRSN